MKILFKSIGVVLATLVVVIGIGAAVVYGMSSAHMHHRYHVKVAVLDVPQTPADIAAGRHIFLTRGCAVCHGADGAGSVVMDNPAMGLFAGANLTPGKGGIGSTFTDADWVRVLRHGVKPDGQPVLFMPVEDYTVMNRHDLGVLIAYLKQLAPVDKPSRGVHPGPIARTLYLVGKFPLVPADTIDQSGPIPVGPAAGPTVVYGRYLVSGLCEGCHGAHLSGGRIPGGDPSWPPSANITPNRDGGLGGWTQTQFVSTLRTGTNPQGKKLRDPMPWTSFAQMSDMELSAIWVYLRTVPAMASGHH